MKKETNQMVDDGFILYLFIISHPCRSLSANRMVSVSYSEQCCLVQRNFRSKINVKQIVPSLQGVESRIRPLVLVKTITVTDG